MKYLILILCVLSSCTGNSVKSVTKEDDSLSFSKNENVNTSHIDFKKPFKIEFGRGSGWHGLDTIKIFSDGKIVIHDIYFEKEKDVTVQYCKTTSFILGSKDLKLIIDFIERELLSLHEHYHDPGVMDGTQWILWIKQHKKEKVIYFDNNFPDKIIQFSKYLDKIIDEKYSSTLKWEQVSEKKSRKHETDIWRSIKNIKSVKH